MRQRARDQNGNLWDIAWGVSDPAATLRGDLGVKGGLQSEGWSTEFPDPHYPAEVKSLRVFSTDQGVIAAMAEITPGVYAAAVRLTEDAPPKDKSRIAILNKIANSGFPSVRFERFYRHYNGSTLTSVPDWSAAQAAEIALMVEEGFLEKSAMIDGPWLDMGETESHIAVTDAGRALIAKAG